MQKVSVTRRAVIQRLNRKLAENDQKLCKTRGAKACQDLGDYYILDVRLNCVMDPNHTDASIEKLARELGVLKKYEEVSE